jgi:hypothetical protein
LGLFLFAVYLFSQHLIDRCVIAFFSAPTVKNCLFAYAVATSISTSSYLKPTPTQNTLRLIAFSSVCVFNSGFSSFTISSDGNFIVLPLSGRVYRVDIRDRRVTAVPALPSSANFPV